MDVVSRSRHPQTHCIPLAAEDSICVGLPIGCPAVNTGAGRQARAAASVSRKRLPLQIVRPPGTVCRGEDGHGKAFAGALPVEQLVPADNLRAPEHLREAGTSCVQPLHLPEIQRLLLLAVCRGQHLPEAPAGTAVRRQAEMTASRQVDGVCPGVKAEFCLRPPCSAPQAGSPCPTAQAESPPDISAGKTSPGRLNMKRPQHLLKRTASFRGGRLLPAVLPAERFRRAEGCPQSSSPAGTAHTLSGSTGPERHRPGRSLPPYSKFLFAALRFQYRDVVVNSIFCPLRQGAHVVQMGVGPYRVIPFGL